MSAATFTGRSVMVTGATRGVGQAIATGFGRRGGRVLVGGPIRSPGGRADFIPADLLDAAPGVPDGT